MERLIHIYLMIIREKSETILQCFENQKRFQDCEPMMRKYVEEVKNLLTENLKCNDLVLLILSFI